MKTTTDKNEQKTTNRLLKVRTMVVNFYEAKDLPYSLITCEATKYFTSVNIDNKCKLTISIHQKQLTLLQKNQFLTTYEVR